MSDRTRLPLTTGGRALMHVLAAAGVGMCAGDAAHAWGLGGAALVVGVVLAGAGLALRVMAGPAR